MIALETASQTAVTKTFGGVTVDVLTDTLFVSNIQLGNDGQFCVAIIQRGTLAKGLFVSNMPDVRIVVSPDGSFSSDDGTWTGTIPNWPATLKQLAAPYDQLLLSTGLVQGNSI
jgi:hypothetical protein